MEKHRQAGANKKGEGSGIKGYQGSGTFGLPPVNYTPFFPLSTLPPSLTSIYRVTFSGTNLLTEVEHILSGFSRVIIINNNKLMYL